MIKNPQKVLEKKYLVGDSPESMIDKDEYHTSASDMTGSFGWSRVELDSMSLLGKFPLSKANYDRIHVLQDNERNDVGNEKSAL